MKSDSINTAVEPPLQRSADVFIHPTTGAEAPDGERWPTFFEKAGETVLRSVIDAQPMRIGEMTVTGGGDLAFDYIVHVPVRTGPGVPTTKDNIRTAMRTALVGADREEASHVLLPAPVNLGKEEIDLMDLVETLVGDLLQYPPVHLDRMTIADPNQPFIEAVSEQLAS